jgi:hypothetical protein
MNTGGTAAATPAPPDDGSRGGGRDVTGGGHRRRRQGQRDPWAGVVGFSDVVVGEDLRVGAAPSMRLLRCFLPAKRRNSNSSADAAPAAAAAEGPRYDAPDGRRWVRDVVVHSVASSEACTLTSPLLQVDKSRRSELPALVTAAAAGSDNSCVTELYAQYNCGTSRSGLGDYLDWLVSTEMWQLDPHHIDSPSKKLALELDHLDRLEAEGGAADGVDDVRNESRPVSASAEVPAAAGHAVREDLSLALQVLRFLYPTIKILRTSKELRQMLLAGYKKPGRAVAVCVPPAE